jgi:muramoyltetrapeptide carboxypeptidase
MLYRRALLARPAQPRYTVEWDGDGPGMRRRGTLWGGNLAMIVSLIGTPWMPEIRDGILVLETSTSIRSASNACCCNCCMRAFCAPARHCAGSFTGATNDYDAGYLDACMSTRSRLSIPVITGLDFGHEQRTVTLALGAQAQLAHATGIRR